MKEGTHYRTMNNLRVRCRSCGKELTSTSKVQCCGCQNQMMIVDDKVGAIDLDQVVMLNSYKNNKQNILTDQDLAYQEQRRGGLIFAIIGFVLIYYIKN